MRILLVCPSWGRQCGIAHYTRNLQGGLEALGVASDVATDPGSIRWLMAEKKYDGALLQHEYGLYYFNLLGVLSSLGNSKIPQVITMHNTDHGGWMGAQHLFLFQNKAKLVVHSREAKDNLLKSVPPPAQSCLRVIPMGCPAYREWDASPTQVRLELGLPVAPFTVGFFGFAAAHKGIPNLVRALLSLPEVSGYIQASTHPVNPGAVDDLYRELGILRRSPERSTHGNVVLSHRIVPDERLGYYQQAVDLIVLPYSQHGTSVSTSMQVCDSLASRRPVMTSTAVYFSGLDKEVQKVSQTTPEAIAEGIETLRGNPTLRQTLVERATAYAEENAWPRVAERYLNLLAEDQNAS